MIGEYLMECTVCGKEFRKKLTWTSKPDISCCGSNYNIEIKQAGIQHLRGDEITQ